MIKAKKGHKQWDKVWSKQVYSSHYYSPIVVRVVEKFHPTRSCELGAGSGVDIVELNRRGLDVVYTDLSKQAIGRFRQRYPKIETIGVDARKLPFKDNSFDFVYSIGLVEHFCKNERRRIIDEHFRVSSKYVLIDVPQKYSLMTPIKNILMKLDRWPFGWETQFSYWSLVSEVKSVIPCRVVFRYGRGFFFLRRKEAGYLYLKIIKNFRVLDRLYFLSHGICFFGGMRSVGVVFKKQV